MPAIGRRCMELRIADQGLAWRIVVRVDPDAIIIAGVFQKKTRKTPRQWIDVCRWRLRDYDHACE